MKTVLIGANNIVGNVIKLAPGTPYDPDPGVTMLSVNDDVRVGPGMRYNDSVSPPVFEDVPAEEQPTLPTTQSDALELAAEALRNAMAAVAAAQALG